MVKSSWWMSASRSTNSSSTSWTTSAMRASGRSTLLITRITGSLASSVLRSTKRVWGSGPSEASTSSSTPSTMESARSTSPPKSACPGVSTMLIVTSPAGPWYVTAVFLARIVMPFSRSRSIESMTRSATSWLARNAPDCQSILSTSVVLPWSTWATMATLRRSARVCTSVVLSVGGRSRLRPVRTGASANRRQAATPSLLRRAWAVDVGTDVVLEEVDDRAVEAVVAVAGNHVPRAGDVHLLGVRHEREHRRGSFLAQQVARAAANEQRRQPQATGSCLEPLGLGHAPGRDAVEPRLVGLLQRHEPRIPVPVPTPVLLVPEVLLQAGQVLGARPVRVVRRD